MLPSTLAELIFFVRFRGKADIRTDQCALKSAIAFSRATEYS